MCFSLALSVGPIYILDVWLWVITVVGTLRILIQKLCKRLLDRLLSESRPSLSNIYSESILHSSGRDSRQKVFDLKSWLLSPKASFIPAHALHPAQHCHSLSTLTLAVTGTQPGHTAHPSALIRVVSQGWCSRRYACCLLTPRIINVEIKGIYI